MMPVGRERKDSIYDILTSHKTDYYATIIVTGSNLKINYLMVKLKIGLQIEVLRSFYQLLLTCKTYQNKSLRLCSFGGVTPMKVVKYSHLYSVLHVILFFFADRLPNIFVENVKPCFESLVPIKGTGTADSVSFD